MMTWIWKALAFLAPLKSWLWPSMALLGVGGVVAWFTTYYEPQGTVDLLEARIEQLEADLTTSRANRRAADSLYQEQLARNRELNRHFDQIRARLREIDDDETKDWRGTRVPGPVADRLRHLRPGSAGVRAPGAPAPAVPEPAS